MLTHWGHHRKRRTKAGQEVQPRGSSQPIKGNIKEREEAGNERRKSENEVKKKTAWVRVARQREAIKETKREVAMVKK